MMKTMPEKLSILSRLTLKKDNQDQLVKPKLYIKNQLRNYLAWIILWPNSKTKSTLLTINTSNKKRKFWDKSGMNTKRFSTRLILQQRNLPISTHCHKAIEPKPLNGVNNIHTNKSKLTISYWKMSSIRSLISSSSHQDSTISSHQKFWTKFWMRVKKEPTEPVWKEASVLHADICLINDRIYLFFF